MVSVTSNYEDKWDEASLRRLLTICGKYGLMEELLCLNSTTEHLRVSFMCSDLFYWATSDAESIEPDDLDLIEQCIADLNAAENRAAYVYASSLYACRKRQMRPQGPWYGYARRRYVEEPIAALFDACGPEREDSPKISRVEDAASSPAV